MNESTQGLIEEYEITPYTLMVMPINYGSKIYSRIIELEDEFISPFKPLDI
ncbi:MAG: competence protein ComK, partial [Peribacillus sp.]